MPRREGEASSLVEGHGPDVCRSRKEERMPRELSQFERYLVHEFVDDYVDGLMSRRDMMRRVLHIVGGVAATATILTQLGVKAASAQEGTPAPPPTPTGPRSSVSVAEDDPRVTASDVT